MTISKSITNVLCKIFSHNYINVPQMQISAKQQLHVTGRYRQIKYIEQSIIVLNKKYLRRKTSALKIQSFFFFISKNGSLFLASFLLYAYRFSFVRTVGDESHLISGHVLNTACKPQITYYP